MAGHNRLTQFAGSLTGRMVLCVVAIQAVLTPLLFWGVLLVVKQGLQEQFIDHVRGDARLFAAHVGSNLRPARAQDLLDEAMLGGQIVFGEVLSPAGKVIAKTHVDGSAATAFREDFFFGQHGDRIYHLSVPLSGRSGRTPAVLRLGYDEGHVLEQINTAYANGIYLAIGYFLLTILLVAFFGNYLAKSLKRLSVTSRRVTSENLDEKFDVEHTLLETTEVKSLAEDLEHMRSELVDSRQAITIRETRLRAIVENVADGIITIDTRGIIESFNPAAEKIFGYQAEEIIGKNVNTLMPEEERVKHDGYIGNYLASGKSKVLGRMPRELIGRRKDGTSCPIEVKITEMKLGQQRIFIGIVRDNTERRAQMAAIRHQSLHDSLTGLPNRSLFRDRLLHAISASQRAKAPFSLLVFDLDGFKIINDTLGHHVGDLVLQNVSRVVNQTLRKSDTMARLGGDEFGIILPTSDAAIATRIAEKIQTKLRVPFLLEGQPVKSGGSIGIAVFPEHGADIETLLRRADAAMYCAKRSNNGVVLYNTGLDRHGRTRFTLGADLRGAIGRKELVMYYQPVLDIESNSISSAEALVRWQHPRLGVVLPDTFITVVEDTGLIEQLTLWTLREAMNQGSVWNRSGTAIRISVNLSPLNFGDRKLHEKIAGILKELAVPASMLELEIAESAILTDPGRLTKLLEQLAGAGIRVVLDNFGASQISLDEFRNLPVSEIKIDRSFVTNMLRNDSDASTVSAAIELAHSLGRKVVAKGVEDIAILNRLKEMECDMVQGHLICRPLSAANFEAWLHDSRFGPIKVETI